MWTIFTSDFNTVLVDLCSPLATKGIQDLHNSIRLFAESPHSSVQAHHEELVFHRASAEVIYINEYFADVRWKSLHLAGVHQTYHSS